jgi:hypothetical protein
MNARLPPVVPLPRMHGAHRVLQIRNGKIKIESEQL